MPRVNPEITVRSPLPCDRSKIMGDRYPHRPRARRPADADRGSARVSRVALSRASHLLATTAYVALPFERVHTMLFALNELLQDVPGPDWRDSSTPAPVELCK